MISDRLAKPWLILLVLVCWSLLLGFTGCAREQPDQQTESARINLDDLINLPEPAAEQPFESLKLAVAAIISPQGTVYSYRPLQAYMEQQLGKPVQLVQRRTYQEVNELLAQGLVDVAFVCTGPFISGLEEGTMELLVVPQVEGKVTYQGMFITAANSRIKTLDDLRGRVFAFTDPMSNTGYDYPMSVIQARGMSAEDFFGRFIFTYSHDRSIAAVLDGVVDGASVDRIVFNHALRANPELKDKFRILHISREFGIPPVVVPPGFDPDQKKLLRDFFLNLHRDPDGAAILAGLGMERFVPGDLEMYH
ncbi:phosphate/phosphite/phosphonate ABC transporter substrate-binding protein [Desulfurivibrio dismutans]|uniref:substrate-binding domain-containing protein n=1 Tax=Desulfurivibrio dismutans TaxID=1398908 RepID=UPI0023DB6A24|nr:phosphate/phosphite/phosphonate ABC transporter substrate-binding protein [Desulfurivibrio alkaliphilus]MDF1614440.1 phosphate/phosphite/phosphonate ABC transporter substrate-binding protein [Desulfurivibrio alkaliphilus]